MRILIAEDDATSRKFLFKLLSEYGECDLVVDGLETLEAYMLAAKDKQPYDLICLDIMMPRVDGVKVLKAIRELEVKKKIAVQNRTKIIMTTALAETQYVQDAYEIGCDAYMTKPIESDKLIQIIKELTNID
jgi:two-component system chemotaxis response regulator CheY